MKTVIDCNVIIAAGLKDGLCRNVLYEIIKNHTNHISSDILLEYVEVVGRSKFIQHKSLLQDIIQTLYEASRFIEYRSSASNPILPDPKDQMYIDLALVVEADYLITGNLKHFPRKLYGSLAIMSPADFLRVATQLKNSAKLLRIP
jgi:uncharacterized protein